MPREGRGVGVLRVAEGVLGHDGDDGDAECGEPGDGVIAEGDGTRRRFIGQQFGIRDPRRIVHAEMQTLPARLLPRAIACDAMPSHAERDFPQLLRVNVQQLAGCLAFVSHDGRAWRKRRLPTEPEPPQHVTDRRQREPDSIGDLRSTAALRAQPSDVPLEACTDLVGRVRRPRGPVTQPRHALRLIPRDPLPDRPHADDKRVRDDRGAPPIPNVSFHEADSPREAQPGILVTVHVVL